MGEYKIAELQSSIAHAVAHATEEKQKTQMKAQVAYKGQPPLSPEWNAIIDEYFSKVYMGTYNTWVSNATFVPGCKDALTKTLGIDPRTAWSICKEGIFAAAF